MPVKIVFLKTNDTLTSQKAPAVEIIEAALNYLGPRAKEVDTESAGKVLFAPCHGYRDTTEAMVNLRRNWHRCPPLEGDKLAACARELARIALYTVELLTCCQGKPEQLAWWAEQMRSARNKGKHVGGFDWRIWTHWDALDEWVGDGSLSRGVSDLKGYHKLEIEGPLPKEIEEPLPKGKKRKRA